MPYIDYQFYTDVFKGASLDEGTFNSLVDRASDMIDLATNDRIILISFNELHPNVQLRVKKATAAQVEFLHLNGGIESLEQGDIQSASIGSFSYSDSSSSSVSTKTLGKQANAYLRMTGLLYAGVQTYG